MPTVSVTTVFFTGTSLQGMTDVTETPNIFELTRRMTREDEEAWRLFHHQFFARTLAAARTLSHCEDEAHEITQLAFLRAVRHIKPFRTEEDVSRWLCCLVRCVAIDLARGRKRRLALLERWHHYREQQQPDPVALALQQERQGWLHQLLNQLPASDADLLRRHYFQGHSHSDLAKACNTTAKAMESKLARLRKHLRHLAHHRPPSL